jgi:hypothetical protein
MANYTAYASNVNAAIPFLKIGGFFSLSQTVDLQNLGVASGDTVDVLPIPSGVRILKAIVKIDTPSDAVTSASATLGDASTNNGFIASIDLKGTAGTETASAESDTWGKTGKYYSSNGTVRMEVTYTGATTQKGKVTVTVYGVRE